MALSVTDLNALKALVVRPLTVEVQSGSALGFWRWVGNSTTTPNDTSVVQPIFGPPGRWLLWLSELTSASIIAALGYTPVNRAGDTMTGTLGVAVGGLTSAAGQAFLFDALGSGNSIYLRTNSTVRMTVADTGMNVAGLMSATPPAGLGRGLQIDQTATGTLGGPFALNAVSITDDVNATNGSGLDHFVEGLTINHDFGGNVVRGGRQAFASYLTLTSATNSANDNRNYVAAAFFGTAETSDGGTGTGYATAKGAMFGAHSVGILQNGATNFLNVTAYEFNVAAQSGSSAYAKTIAQFSGRYDDAVHGSTIDAMLWLYKQTSAAVYWTDGILFAYPDDLDSFPFTSSSTVIRTGAGTFGVGLDFSASTIATFAIKTPGFTVGPSGDVVITAASTSANATLSLTGGSVSGYGSLEIGGGGGGFIDMKSPMSDDFDVRLITNGTSFTIDTVSGVNMVLGVGGASNSIAFATDSTTRLTIADSVITATLGIATSEFFYVTKFIEGTEQSAPAAPSANGYRIFAQDNGGGKTQLMVIFGSGAAQQIAIEP